MVCFRTVRGISPTEIVIGYLDRDRRHQGWKQEALFICVSLGSVDSYPKAGTLAEGT